MSNIIDMETPDQLQYHFLPAPNGAVQFKVRAPNDAHIALTSGPHESEPMLEVFIGGWGNTKSVIRRNRTKPDKVEIETPDILNGGEFRGFWVRWDNGVISAGREGEAVPFISWQDPEPFPISFFGVCTGWGATGNWKIEEMNEIVTPDNLQYVFHPVTTGSLEFEYRGPSNCHVSLTQGMNETELMYEFIVGGWDNTQSVIRRCRQKPDKVALPTPNIVRPDEFRKFLIQWTCGRLHLRDGSTGEVILEWADPSPFPVSFIGVRSAYGASPSAPSAPAAAAFSAANYYGSQSGYPGGQGGSGNWVDADGGQVPPGAVQGGQDCNGEPMFVIRAQHEGAMIPGKLVPSHGCAYVPWGGVENGKPQYQVLVGGPNNWVPANGSNIPPGAFPGGESEEGEPLYVGRVRHEGSVTVGKVQQSHGVCYISFAGQELGFPEYEVLMP